MRHTNLDENMLQSVLLFSYSYKSSSVCVGVGGTNLFNFKRN